MLDMIGGFVLGCSCVFSCQGHLSGILVGYMISFGLLDWVDDFTFWVFFFWYPDSYFWSTNVL